MGITRYWETNALFNSGGSGVLIANNEVTRTSGGAMHVISNEHGRNDGTEDWIINVEYNYIHDFGAGITNDFGGIKTGVQGHCDDLSEEEMIRSMPFPLYEEDDLPELPDIDMLNLQLEKNLVPFS